MYTVEDSQVSKYLAACLNTKGILGIENLAKNE